MPTVKGSRNGKTESSSTTLDESRKPDRGVRIRKTSTHPYDDYLAQHANVRNAIVWRQNGLAIPYDRWDANLVTRGFGSTLADFYAALDAGQPVPFSFRTYPGQDTPPIAGVAPGLYSQEYMEAADASQIFLAHIAQSLWIEVNQKVPWRLHSYTAGQLSLLLRSSGMFIEGTASNNAVGLFEINSDVCGTGMPGDPTKTYQFVTSLNRIVLPLPILRNQRRERVFVLFRWIRDHMTHGPWVDDGTGVARPISGGDLGELAYGYRGPAPIQSMFHRVRFTAPDGQVYGPKCFAWDGCHSSGALVVWVLRTLNIPCQAPATQWINGGIHAGMDLPADKLFSAHMDDFYAMPPTLDPAIQPEEIFEAATNYDSVKKNYTADPPVMTDVDYGQAIALKGLAHPTYRYVDLFWTDQVYNSNLLDNELLNGALFPPGALPGLHGQYDAKLQAAIDAFKAKNGLQNAPETAALEAYEAAYATWVKAR